MIATRLKSLRKFLQAQHVEAMIISKNENLYYFSGFRGDDSVLLITARENYLLTDSRYTEQAKLEAPLFSVLEQKDGLLKEVSKLLLDQKIDRIGYEGNNMTCDAFSSIQSFLQNAVNFSSLDLSPLRVQKDSEEIKYLKKAAKIADTAFQEVLTYIRAGVSERQVAIFLEQKMQDLGSEKPSFTTIVASGVRGSLPHGVATEKLLQKEEFVTMDFGAVYKGYHSDMTRTIAIGKVSDEKLRWYEAVLKAQKLGVSLVFNGANPRTIDLKVRKCLAEYDLEKYFLHGLGHSLGLEIHEEPRLSPKSNTDALQENMLITVEPGVYLLGKGGVRIEDTLVVTATGNEIITESPKELIVV